MRLAASSLALALIFACSQTGDGGGAGGSGGAGGPLTGQAGASGQSGAAGFPACIPTAPTRMCDPVCPAGQHCWDFKDHDPYCGGKACSAPCCTDAACVAFFAGHANAANARCGTDHLCDPVGFGGAFFCAAR